MQTQEHPDLSSLLRVERSPKAFGSRATSLVSLPPGALFARITSATPAQKAYTSVQTSRDTHIELNSDLVFCNHSCDPSVEFDMERFEVRVVKDRPLEKGEPVTFFYPSSEWEMAQPFECECGGERCRGLIKGAKDMGERELEGYWLNGHIVGLLEERRAGRNGVVRESKV
ncbi:hypothetical protein W97_05632 [Coniosporium apollinis CBS 100218]|uniref:Post-SET domain-containing protein n=1 Tax=Coniosporium apollinis (strain CBS 100218) TaxID=1168221 RepID=R7YWQ8_CONA1|nr:uncharacterized protein W97_05632 [Coniosporium apollinis CBS 100218]EON66239.1 hypothetical protein W97_05632 [Coniosporium apollinis CBS 100218]